MERPDCPNVPAKLSLSAMPSEELSGYGSHGGAPEYPASADMKQQRPRAGGQPKGL